MTLRDVRSGVEDLTTWANDTRPRVGFGLGFFDKRTNGGLAKAECAMVLASSSVGKTSIALNVIANNPKVPTVFFSIEMSWRQVVARLTAITSGTPTRELEELLKQGTTPQTVNTSIQFPVLLGDDSSEMSMKDMKHTIGEASDKLGLPIGLVVIDYLELIGGSGMLGKSEAVDRAAQKIRALAKDCDTRVIVLHQVGKADGSGGHEPLDLESGKYGGHHPMDYVVGCYAPRLDKKRYGEPGIDAELWLQLLKNRSDMAWPQGVKHYLDPISGKLSEWGQQHTGYSTAVYQPELTVPTVTTGELGSTVLIDPTQPPAWLVSDSSRLDTNEPVWGASENEWQREAARDIGPDF